jgi:ribose transport system permease protein
MVRRAPAVKSPDSSDSRRSSASEVGGRRVMVPVGLERYGLVFLLAGLVIGFSLALPGIFPTLNDFRTIVETQTVVLTLTIGLLFPLSAGDFDLSVSATLVLSAIVVALGVNDWHTGLALSILIGLAVGLLVGTVNAILVVLVGLNGFIATLATMTIIGSIALGISNQTTVVLNNQALLTDLGRPVFSLPLCTYLGWAAALIVWYLLEKAPFGRHLRVTGSAREAARLTGLPTRGLRISAFIICGAVAGIAALFLLSTVGSADPTSAGDYLLEPYAAAFLGTATIQLGRFNVVGALVAIYIVIVGSTGLELLGVPAWSSQLFEGLVLLAGLVLARISSRQVQNVVGHAT